MNQSKRTSFVLAAGVIVLVFGIVGYAIPAKDAETPQRVYYENAGGGVLFPHHQHEGFACERCHHEMLVEEVTTDCTFCHHAGGPFEVAEWEDESMAEFHMEFTDEDYSACIGCHAHDEFKVSATPAFESTCAMCHEDDGIDEMFVLPGHNCMTCHELAEEEVELLACNECHQSGEGEARDCATCHESEGYEYDMFEHADLTSMGGHSCMDCHVATRGSDAIHDRCLRCHYDQEELTFFTRSKEDTDSVCKTCHMQP